MILLLLACKEDPKISGEPHPVDAEIPIEELEDIVNQNFNSGLPSMLEMNEVYRDMMSWGDENCPAFSPYENGIEGHWVDDCVSSSGAHFFGFCQFYDVLESQQPDGSKMGTIWGSFETVASDGRSLQIGGTGSLRLHPEMRVVTQMFEGTFLVPDSFPWLESGSQTYILDGVIDQLITLSGGIQYPDVIVHFNDLNYHPEACENGIGIQGEMLIRDSSGYWFSTERTGCTPCSDIFWGEENMGEFCVWESLDSAIKSYLSDVDAAMYP